MSIYGKYDKTCATCLYWKGKRQIEFKFIEAMECEGKCGCEEGFYDLKTTDASCCSDWKGFSGQEE
ncbi:hypothetical protein M2651_01255 [Clostridium sp. SYSU_GA19001]|uniref:hypothetical protein n=1 Tax=Clostridium caldaquaticum TaxID=2940653 RepID=UPI0020778F5D|nr:hypothetical protein [Clostridium caldaquaticum]MCM8709647.1 hypothetical protein [Clostridium caldaquaticum]